MSHLQIHVGDTLAADSLDRARAEVRAFDEHLNVGTATTPNGEVTLMIQMPGSAGYGRGLRRRHRPAAVTMPPPADGTKRITIGGNVQQAKLVSQTRPVYPPLAKQARISGVVHLSALIGKEGNVINLAVISGHPLLIPSALDAVKTVGLSNHTAQRRTRGSHAPRSTSTTPCPTIPPSSSNCSYHPGAQPPPPEPRPDPRPDPSEPRPDPSSHDRQGVVASARTVSSRRSSIQ